MKRSKLLQLLGDRAHMETVVATEVGRSMLRGMADKSERLAADLEHKLEIARDELALIREWLGEVVE